MRTTATLGLVLLSLAAAGAAQDLDPAKVEFKVTKVAGSVTMLSGAGGNIGVSIGPDAVFIVDDEYAPLTPKLKAALAVLDPRAPRFVLNTHWHGDHTGGNKDLGEAGVLIVAHDNVRKRMSTDQFIALFNHHVPASPAAALPVVTFNDTVTFHLNGDDIEAFHVAPAHTDGDAVVHFAAADVIVAGDVFFNGMYPFVDASSGGSFDGMIAADERILAVAKPTTKIIPGHGPLATREDLVAFRDMLVTVRDRVAPMVKAGKSLAEVKAARPTKDLDAKWGNGFAKGDDFVEIAYSTIKR